MTCPDRACNRCGGGGPSFVRVTHDEVEEQLCGRCDEDRWHVEQLFMRADAVRSTRDAWRLSWAAARLASRGLDTVDVTATDTFDLEAVTCLEARRSAVRLQVRYLRIAIRKAKCGDVVVMDTT